VVCAMVAGDEVAVGDRRGGQWHMVVGFVVIYMCVDEGEGEVEACKVVQLDVGTGFYFYGVPANSTISLSISISISMVLTFRSVTFSVRLLSLGYSHRGCTKHPTGDGSQFLRNNLSRFFTTQPARCVIVARRTAEKTARRSRRRCVRIRTARTLPSNVQF